MRKEVKQAQQNFSRESLKGVGTFLGFCILAVILLRFLFTQKFRRKGQSTPDYLRIKFAGTEKQKRYLEGLVSHQNFFRSKAVSLDEWLRQRAPRGVVSVRFASKLIDSLKSENEALEKKFKTLREKQGIGSFRKEMRVSDLRAFFFCERAAYYSTHGYPSQNLIDLDRGRRIHGAYSNETKRDSARPALVASFIRKQDPEVEKVDWLPNTLEAEFRHSVFPLSGRPDGFLRYADGTKAVIELKTVATLPAKPKDGDFLQADIYALLLPKEMKVRDESFVLYMERSSRRLAIHRRMRAMKESDLAEVMDRIERGARSIELLSKARFEAQCSSCGYRSLCLRSH